MECRLLGGDEVAHQTNLIIESGRRGLELDGRGGH